MHDDSSRGNSEVERLIREGEDSEPDPEDPFRKIVDEVYYLLLKKHHDYGPDNLNEFGTHGILIRVSDKRNRIKHMQASGKDGGLVGDKEEQEWIDVAGYAIQAVRMLRGRRVIDSNAIE